MLSLAKSEPKKPSERLFLVQRQLMLLKHQVESSKITIRLLNLHLKQKK